MSRMRRSSVASAGVRSATSAAVAQHHDPVGDGAHLVEPVADEDHDAAGARVPARELEHAVGLGRAERRGRLVEDQHQRLAAERLRDLDHLALRDRERVDPPPQSARRDRPRRAAPCAAASIARRSTSTRRSLGRRPSSRFSATLSWPTSGNSCETIATPSACACSVPPRVEQLARDRDGAGVGRHRSGDHAHHRRLAGAVLADEADDLASAQDQMVQVEHDGRPVQLADTGEEEVPTGVRDAVGRRSANRRQLPCCRRYRPAGSPWSACRPRC